MGMHQPGWRERNEERATEQWRADVGELVARLQIATARVDEAMWAKGEPGRAIMDALTEIDAASEALWAIRHGPENPDH